jgi:NH3-dependent NAD+ synthetase
MAKDFAIVLNNGGINSAVATALAAQKYRPILMYAESSQATSSRQRAAYDQQVTYFKPYREQTVTLPAMPAVRPAAVATAADPRLNSPVSTRLIDMLGMMALAAQYAAQYQAAAIYISRSGGRLCRFRAG